MKKRKEQMVLGMVFILISFIVYMIHYFIFKDLHHIGVFLLEDIAFIPIEVLIVSLILEKLLEKRELNHKMEKMNIIKGIFFSEIGNEILRLIIESDKNIDDIKQRYLASMDWFIEPLNTQLKYIEDYNHDLNVEDFNLKKLKAMIYENKDFLIKTMENPILVEHENFTDLLMAIFHIKEEFFYRKEIEQMEEKDKKHLNLDIERVYKLILSEWIIYMNHMKDEYPYLFITAMKHNPFDQREEEQIEKILVEAYNKSKR